MGMFDYIKCEMPLPETGVPPPTDLFQTKDTPDQYLTVYTITADGQLVWRPYEMEIVPKEERPYPNDDGILGMAGMLRRVEGEPAAVPFHGDIYFYEGNHPDVGWWEYRARFTEGKVNKIELSEYRAPEGRDVNAEIEEHRKEKGAGVQ